MAMWVRLTGEEGGPVQVNLDLVQTIAPRRKGGAKLAFGPTSDDFVNVTESLDEIADIITSAPHA
jgi:hypothetical protein